VWLDVGCFCSAMLEQFVVSVKVECLRLKGLLSMTTEAQMSGFEKTS